MMILSIQSVILVLCSCRFKVATSFTTFPVAQQIRRPQQLQRSFRSNYRNLRVLPEVLSTLVSDAIPICGSHVLLSSFLLKETNPQSAEAQFYFLFFAGSGAGGIGLAQIPRITQELSLIRSLAKEGPTEGGPTVTMSNPAYALLYPKPLSEKDVRKVIAKIPTAAKINAQGKSESYFASLGYVVQEDFLQVLASQGCNPLATYAAFEALSGGSGKCISPTDVDAKVALYRSETDLKQFANDVQGAAVRKLSAYLTLAFLLFITADLIVETGISAFMS